MIKWVIGSFVILFVWGCNAPHSNRYEFEVYQTSRSGQKLEKILPGEENYEEEIQILPNEVFQEITGFGGAFTESSASLLNQMSAPKRKEILESYFASSGANYSLTRTHINSCDFSLDHYSYDSVANDTELIHFSIQPDQDDIIPMIKEAQLISTDGFNIIASPWTAPPWMKTNKDWNGGELLPEYYPTWASYLSKYIDSYQKKGIPIWGLTVENEPLGNNESWESMHYTPEEMAVFVKHHLGPQFKKDGWDTRILVYDQNRGIDLTDWSKVLLSDEELAPWIYGTAVHWYSSTYKWFPQSLQYTHDLNSSKHIIQTEGCVDSEVPHWQDDDWYWQKEATDWGYEWALPENKHNHPKYVPVYRYARDMIGCMNNWVEGWIDWNMVLDEHGGPNLANNWCVAPVLVNPKLDEVYYTPLYYIMCHFSKFIRPGSHRIGFNSTDDDLMVTATENNGNYTVVVLNMSETDKKFKVKVNGSSASVQMQPQSLQTILITKRKE